MWCVCGVCVPCVCVCRVCVCVCLCVQCVCSVSAVQSAVCPIQSTFCPIISTSSSTNESAIATGRERGCSPARTLERPVAGPLPTKTRRAVNGARAKRLGAAEISTSIGAASLRRIAARARGTSLLAPLKTTSASAAPMVLCYGNASDSRQYPPPVSNRGMQLPFISPPTTTSASGMQRAVLLLACLAQAAALATGVRGGASPPPTAMIAGGGIGGLVTALTLRNEGYDVCHRGLEL